MNDFNFTTSERSYGDSLQKFHDLMPHRVREILLVSSLYDYYTISEEGGLYESLFDEYVALGLHGMPEITRAPSREEALRRVAAEPARYDLVIILQSAASAEPFDLARQIKSMAPSMAIALLAWETRLGEKDITRLDIEAFDKVFVWQGDFRIFLAIVKYFEDRFNIENDTKVVGVQSIILIEDDPRYYSSFLPVVYKEVVEHTTRLFSESVNQAQRQLRMRARPKIILCSTYEEAWQYFEMYSAHILGVITDIEFPRLGRLDKEAGFVFFKNVRALNSDVPVLFQSSDESCKSRVESSGAGFARKDSDTLLSDLRNFMIYNMGFGNFIFRMPDGRIVGEASDLRSLEEIMGKVPVDSVRYHADHNHFSRWLKSRTEHLFARKIREHRAAECVTREEAREWLLNAFRQYRWEQSRGRVIDFDPETFDPLRSFARIGGGSLGGKSRGLAFANSLLRTNPVEKHIPETTVEVPPSLALATELFDRFMESNRLRDFALHCQDDEVIRKRFLESDFDGDIVAFLREYLRKVRYPLAVRSSSLLEDSHEMPFAGIYETFMLPNNAANLNERLHNLLTAVKRVYASTYARRARTYFRSTPYRLEEEKMGVLIQKLTGKPHGSRFYPDLSGTARSENHYPIPPVSLHDGIAAIALGLGKTVVDGGASLRFCPRYPRHLVQFSSAEDILHYSQTQFYALDMLPDDTSEKFELANCDLEAALQDGVLPYVASVYNRENNVIYDGLGRPGTPVVTFAPILKYDRFPLARTLEFLLALGRHGLDGPVEIEFAVNFEAETGSKSEFSLLQMRPIVSSSSLDSPSESDFSLGEIICRSSCVLGNGSIRGIQDIIVVDKDKFDRKNSLAVAREIGLLNWQLLNAKRSYILIGVGRWGSADPWLGIPVRWEDINGARVIVETSFKSMQVTPSQGTHFFHNVTSSRIGYFTVSSQTDQNFVDWQWLAGQKALYENGCTRHIRCDRPITAIMDGRSGKGVIGLAI